MQVNATRPSLSRVGGVLSSRPFYSEQHPAEMGRTQPAGMFTIPQFMLQNFSGEEDTGKSVW